MDRTNATLFGAHAEETPAALAAALAPPAAPGHYDELRGGVSAPLPDPQASSITRVGAHALPTRPWARFFENLGRDGFADLDRRTADLQRQVRDNGITYNVYAGHGGPQRPWSLDLFPLILTPQGWQRIEQGVLQRVRLLERILDDVYGAQQLLAGNLLPPALVHGHPGYLRAMHGVPPPGGRRLHIAAFDLARDPGGAWWVLAQRTEAPSGLGYLLENRLIVSRLFPEAFRDLRVQRLGATYAALLESLTARCPGGLREPRIVLLTPGPHNETYFEHAYLARYLGLTLVEGSDLTVRDERLFLKTLKGLEPVDGVLKRLDDEFLDPLELRADSHLGVPGLLQAVRAGNVLVANAPGSSFLESTALLGFLPALSRHLLGEDLRLPAVPTWWCGERAAMLAALPRLDHSVIRPTYGGAGAGMVLGSKLSPRQLDEWHTRIPAAPEQHTLQEYLPLSQLPTWQGGAGRARIVPRSLLLRVFAVSDGGGGWRVLPGGLTRLAVDDTGIASMQRGGSSADTWVLTEGAVDPDSRPGRGDPSPAAPHRNRTVSSRAAENLFWLGRYTERTENTARLARLALERLNGEDQGVRPLLAWLGEAALASGLLPATVPPPTQSRRLFEHSLMAALPDDGQATSVGFNLGALRAAAAGVRERLSQEHWNLIVRADEDFQAGCAACLQGGGRSPVEMLRVLEKLSLETAAITGAQTDRMVRDDGWRLLSTGRHLERLGFLAQALAGAFDTGAVHDRAGFAAVVDLFDSTITFRSQYQQRHDVPALLDLLVLDAANPRSLRWVAQTLRGRLARLADAPAGEMPALALIVPDPQPWTLEALCRRDGNESHADLLELLQACVDASFRLCDELGARYFAHVDDRRHSVGA